MRCFLLGSIFLAVLATPVIAQQKTPENSQLRSGALDFVIQQRNNALDGLAVCQADATHKLEAVQKEIEDLKKQIEAAKSPASPPAPPK